MERRRKPLWQFRRKENDNNVKAEFIKATIQSNGQYSVQIGTNGKFQTYLPRKGWPGVLRLVIVFTAFPSLITRGGIAIPLLRSRPVSSALVCPPSCRGFALYLTIGILL